MDELDEFYDYTAALVKSGIDVRDVAGDDEDDEEEEESAADDDDGVEERKTGPRERVKPLLTPQDIRAGAGVRLNEGGGACSVTGQSAGAGVRGDAFHETGSKETMGGGCGALHG